MTKAGEYRAAYTEQLRGRLRQNHPEGPTYERIGPIVRRFGGGRPGFIDYRDLGGLDGDVLDTFIQQQRDFYAARNEQVEWKYHDYDLPTDLPQRLTQLGFEPDDEEMILIGEAKDLAVDTAPPDGITIREVDQRDDDERIAAMSGAVWNADHSWLIDALGDVRALGGVVLTAEADNEVVSAAWLQVANGTDFAGLWGGSTLKEWRGRGIYRALVAHRAKIAVAQGFRYLQVDASEDSRPILARLGLVPVAMTTPYNWRPPAE